WTVQPNVDGGPKWNGAHQLHLCHGDQSAGIADAAGSSVEYEYETNRDLVSFVYNEAGATLRARYYSQYDGDGRRWQMTGHGTAFSSMNSVRHTYEYNDRHEVTEDLVQRGGSSSDTVPTDSTQAT